MLLAFPHGITVRGGRMVILLVIRTELGDKVIFHFLLKRKKPCDTYFISSFHITVYCGKLHVIAFRLTLFLKISCLFVFNFYFMLEYSLPMQGAQVPYLGLEDCLEKEMATHSSILAWEIPWAKEPGRLQTMGRESRAWPSN